MSTDTLREIVLDMLADGGDLTDGDADGRWVMVRAYKIRGSDMDRLCRLAGFKGGAPEALDAIEASLTPLQVETLQAIAAGKVRIVNRGAAAYRIDGAAPTVVGRLVSLGLARWPGYRLPGEVCKLTPEGQAAIALIQPAKGPAMRVIAEPTPPPGGGSRDGCDRRRWKCSAP